MSDVQPKTESAVPVAGGTSQTHNVFKNKWVIGVVAGLAILAITFIALYFLANSSINTLEEDKTKLEKEKIILEEQKKKLEEQINILKKVDTSKRTTYPEKTFTATTAQAPAKAPYTTPNKEEVTFTTLTKTKGKVLSTAIPQFKDDAGNKDCLLCTEWAKSAESDATNGIFKSEAKTSAMLWNLYSQPAGDAAAKTAVETKFHKQAEATSTYEQHKQLTVANMFTGDAAQMYDKNAEPFKIGSAAATDDLPFKDQYNFGLVKASSDKYKWGSPGKCPFWNLPPNTFPEYKQRPLWEMMETSATTVGNDGKSVVLDKWYKLNSWARNVYVCLVPPADAKWLYISSISTDINSKSCSYVALVHNTETVEVETEKHLLNATGLKAGATADKKKVPKACLKRVTVTTTTENGKTQYDMSESQKPFPNRPFNDNTKAPTMMEFDLTNRNHINIIGKIGTEKALHMRTETTWMYTKDQLTEDKLKPS